MLKAIEGIPRPAVQASLYLRLRRTGNFWLFVFEERGSAARSRCPFENTLPQGVSSVDLD